MDRVDSVLVINVSRIGDTLLATPAIRAIAATFEGARLTCLAHPNRAEVLRNLPFIHRVGTITKKRAPLLGRLSPKRYDLAFVYGFDTPLVRYALRVARRVIAFHQDVPSIDARLYRAVPPPPFQSAHSVHLNLALPAAAGVAPRGLALSYCVADEEARWAAATLARRLPAGAWPLVGLQIASFPTKAYRDWPVEQFGALCERILSHHPRAHFLIFGGSLDRKRTETLHRQFPSRSELFAGKLTLRQTAALMSRVDLYVGVDTGPTHIMGTMGIPMVVLYHCYSPSRLIAPLDHPCLFAVDHPRPANDCDVETPMAEISMEAVWSRVELALQRAPVAPPAGVTDR